MSEHEFTLTNGGHLGSLFVGSDSSVAAPPRLYTALEARVAFEYPLWLMSRPLLEFLPRGDGHSVLVLPGFTASDRSTVQLRDLLDSIGYRSYGWALGANLGPTRHIVAGLNERLETILAEGGRQPISIVGWSLGGIFGRELARSNPERVRQVITLGSPIRMVPGDQSAASGVWESLQDLHDPEAIKLMSDPERLPLPVPTTSIYTRTDGIVHWRTCLESKGPISENVEVFGSHCGLGFNPAAVMVVADRLAQKAGKWRRYRPPLWARAAYPYPTNWKPPAEATAA